MGTEGKPDYEIEPLLRVNYHFRWQMSYRISEPRFLRAGAELQAVAWYDNSKANPHNPDWQAEVRWGGTDLRRNEGGFSRRRGSRRRGQAALFRPGERTTTSSVTDLS